MPIFESVLGGLLQRCAMYLDVHENVRTRPKSPGSKIGICRRSLNKVR